MPRSPAAAMATLLLAVLPSSTDAQEPSAPAPGGVMRSAVLRADVPAEGGTARVRIDYVLETEADVISVELLRFGATAVELLRFGATAVEALGVDGGPSGGSVGLRAGPGRRLAAELPLPPPGPGGLRRLSVFYDVTSAVESSGTTYRVRLPVASLGLPPPPDVAGRPFAAEVRAPAAWSVTEGFPSGLAAGSEGRITVELAVAPAVVSFRGRKDGRRPPGLQLLLGTLGGAVLLVLGLAGWRHLHRMAA